MNKFYSRLLLFLAWSFFILKLLTIAMPEYPGNKITFYDKFVHLFLFAVLTFLFVYCCRTTKYKNNNRIMYLGAIIFSIIFSAMGEYLQNYIPGRDVSEYDFFAGVFGAVLAGIFAFLLFKEKKKKLLLHVCCMSCASAASLELKREYDLTLYFYNPNIFPKEEYNKRLEEAIRITKKFKIKLIIDKYNHKQWLQRVRGYEKEPEGGKRCEICYYDRLQKTAQLAQKKKMDLFGTILTVSPHKKAPIISAIGNELENKYGISYYNRDFKKKDGFKKSVQMSYELCLYRQDYCGCEFSLAESIARKNKNK